MKKVLTFIAVVAVIAALCMPVSAEIYPQYMETESYDVEVRVAEDNTLYVTEQISVNFLESRHGIYRYIPYILDFYHEVDGEMVEKRMRAKISNVTVAGEIFEVSEEDNCELIIIGSEDEYVRGQKSYTISYTMQIYDDGIDKADFFYFNLLPHDWETDIEKFSARITFDKSLPEGVTPYFYRGTYGAVSDSGLKTELNTAGDQITVSSTEPLYAGEGVTCDITLPEGYFTGEANTDSAPVIAMAIALAVAAVAAGMYFLLGRDEKVIPVVNFYPPKGLTSAEIGHIVDGGTDQKDMVSLLIYWADKGLLEIRQESDDDFTLIKKAELPRNAKGYEAVMFNGLFAGRDEVTISQLKNKFYVTMQEATSEINRYFNVIPENRVYTVSSSVARILSLLLCGVPMAASAALCFFAANFGDGACFVSAIIIYIVLLLLGLFNMGVWDKKHAMQKGKFKAAAIALAVATAVAAAAAALLVGAVSGYLTAAVLGALASVAAIYFAVFTSKRTKANTRLMGEIVGFKEFIETAELERLNMLVEENPQYFYNIIPYAYVMGLSDKWAKNFEGIALQPPTWYFGYDYPFSTWMFMRSVNRCMTDCRNVMVSQPQAKGGTGSFGGGGGFSGGGFGGGGGGSW